MLVQARQLIGSPRRRGRAGSGGTSRPSALAVLISDWSGLVDLVDGNDGKRAGPTRIVHAGHGIDGLTDLCDGKTVAWRDHAGRTCPSIGSRIIDLVCPEYAAIIVHP